MGRATSSPHFLVLRFSCSRELLPVNLVPEIEYQAPPVMQRTFTVHAPFPDERFYANIGLFRESIREGFPHKDPKQEWDIKIETNPSNGHL